MSCTPSARLEEKLKERFGDKSSPFAEEGTRAHALAELKLQKEIGLINDFSYKTQRAAMTDVDNEMEWATNQYVDIVMQKYYEAKKACPDTQLFIEQRLDFSKWVPKGFGTGDVVIVSDLILDVCDLKYGKGVPVSAEENPQARCYGLGALSAFGDLYGFPRVRNTIIQPRLDSVTEETLTREELVRWAEEELQPKAELAWEGEGEYNPGDHCRFCAARALCYHRAAKCMQIFDSGMLTPGILPDEEIPRILEVADVAEAWIKDIRDYARSQALKGQTWRGFKLVEGRRPPRKWANTEDVIDQMSRAGYTDEQIYKPRELINPGEAEKLMGKPAFRAILGPLCLQKEGAPTLVPDSDKRLAINSTDAAFADLLEGDL
jgi:hypothetical protein